LLQRGSGFLAGMEWGPDEERARFRVYCFVALDVIKSSGCVPFVEAIHQNYTAVRFQQSCVHTSQVIQPARFVISCSFTHSKGHMQTNLALIIKLAALQASIFESAFVNEGTSPHRTGLITISPDWES
jgi:hypothetical protein